MNKQIVTVFVRVVYFFWVLSHLHLLLAQKIKNLSDKNQRYLKKDCMRYERKYYSHHN